jgi:hypothetical protein
MRGRMRRIAPASPNAASSSGVDSGVCGVGRHRHSGVPQECAVHAGRLASTNFDALQ